ncbi:DUF2306 domain-containing protein [Demequina globuliformis]|uniref:DUF2306 domain-containing protein n=1 Tax=Demequina globuliformis TaxID=676202 RepID=UPI0007834C46|nr:DUF2306 domain-containing protein [Demequina globuliformis]
MSAPTAPAPAPAPTRAARTGWWVITGLALVIVLVSLGTYMTQSLADIGDDSSVARTYANGPAALQSAFYAHVVAASAALALGPFQFSQRLRRRFTAAHRASGRVYVGAVAIGGVSGLVIAPFNSAGALGTAGFGMLGALWLVSVVMAYRAARRRDLPRHRAWMIRNYALTFAAVTLRAWLPILIVATVAAGETDPEAAFASAYLWVPFLCWVPNIAVAEWLVVRRGLPSVVTLWNRRATRH